MTATLNTTSKNILKNMGYQDVNDFIITQSKRILIDKIKEEQDIINGFEQKYGMNYQQFVERVLDKADSILAKFSIIEKENDDFDWDNAIDFLEIYQERLQSL